MRYMTTALSGSFTRRGRLSRALLSDRRAGRIHADVHVCAHERAWAVLPGSASASDASDRPRRIRPTAASAESGARSTDEDTITGHEMLGLPRGLPQRSGSPAFQAECRGFETRLPLHFHFRAQHDTITAPSCVRIVGQIRRNPPLQRSDGQPTCRRSVRLPLDRLDYAHSRGIVQGGHRLRKLPRLLRGLLERFGRSMDGRLALLFLEAAHPNLQESHAVRGVSVHVLHSSKSSMSTSSPLGLTPQLPGFRF
jgi:hypothetical protein